MAIQVFGHELRASTVDTGSRGAISFEFFENCARETLIFQVRVTPLWLVATAELPAAPAVWRWEVCLQEIRNITISMPELIYERMRLSFGPAASPTERHILQAFAAAYPNMFDRPCPVTIAADPRAYTSEFQAAVEARMRRIEEGAFFASPVSTPAAPAAPLRDHNTAAASRARESYRSEDRADRPPALAPPRKGLPTYRPS